MTKQSSHKANSKSDNGSSSSRSPPKLDSLDVKIIEELLADAYASSAKIASKHGVPLSTIQRRRAALESMSMLKLKYSLDPIPFGLRPIEYWVKVERGRAGDVAQYIFEKYENILKVTVQINSISNVGVEAYVNNSGQLYRMLEELKSMRYVISVEFAEIVNIVGERQANFFK